MICERIGWSISLIPSFYSNTVLHLLILNKTKPAKFTSISFPLEGNRNLWKVKVFKATLEHEEKNGTNQLAEHYDCQEGKFEKQSWESWSPFIFIKFHHQEKLKNFGIFKQFQKLKISKLKLS